MVMNGFGVNISLPNYLSEGQVFEIQAFSGQNISPGLNLGVYRKVQPLTPPGSLTLISGIWSCIQTKFLGPVY